MQSPTSTSPRRGILNASKRSVQDKHETSTQKNQTNTHHEIEERRGVTFSKICSVILVPCRKEYDAAGIELWFTGKYYETAKIDATIEVKTKMQEFPGMSFAEAVYDLYQQQQPPQQEDSSGSISAASIGPTDTSSSGGTDTADINGDKAQVPTIITAAVAKAEVVGVVAADEVAVALEKEKHVEDMDKGATTVAAAKNAHSISILQSGTSPRLRSHAGNVPMPLSLPSSPLMKSLPSPLSTSFSLSSSYSYSSYSCTGGTGATDIESANLGSQSGSPNGGFSPSSSLSSPSSPQSMESALPLPLPLPLLLRRTRSGSLMNANVCKVCIVASKHVHDMITSLTTQEFHVYEHALARRIEMKTGLLIPLSNATHAATTSLFYSHSHASSNDGSASASQDTDDYMSHIVSPYYQCNYSSIYSVSDVQNVVATWLTDTEEATLQEVFSHKINRTITPALQEGDEDGYGYDQVEETYYDHADAEDHKQGNATANAAAADDDDCDCDDDATIAMPLSLPIPTVFKATPSIYTTAQATAAAAANAAKGKPLIVTPMAWSLLSLARPVETPTPMPIDNEELYEKTSADSNDKHTGTTAMNFNHLGMSPVPKHRSKRPCPVVTAGLEFDLDLDMGLNLDTVGAKPCTSPPPPAFSSSTSNQSMPLTNVCVVIIDPSAVLTQKDLEESYKLEEKHTYSILLNSKYKDGIGIGIGVGIGNQTHTHTYGDGRSHSPPHSQVIIVRECLSDLIS